MNLANTFARIRTLFRPRREKTIRLLEMSDHLKRDIGVNDFNSTRRVHEREAVKREFIVTGTVTRAP